MTSPAERCRRLLTVGAFFLLTHFAGPQIVAGQPDLSGNYDVSTLTPLERPEIYGNRLYLTPEEGAKLEEQAERWRQTTSQDSDPERPAPKKGASVGGYNTFWLDRGERVTTIDGLFRTSIISHPVNGRRPPMTAEGAARLQGLLDAWRIVWRDPDPSVGMNDGIAWWLELPSGGPYDDIEQRPLAERCILGSRSTAGPPMLPNLYNNFKTIVQTDSHIVILTEMNHDARIVRMDSEHQRPEYRSWFGDSIGRWEGDTLIVETTNFGPTPPLSGTDENLEVTEEFSRLENGDLLYRFTVVDPTIWAEAWSGEYSWAATDGKVYEYACHEGNYTLGNVLRGARSLETRSLQAPQ